MFTIFSCILNLKLGGAKDTLRRMKLMRNEGGKLFGTRMDVVCVTLNWGHVFVVSFLDAKNLVPKSQRPKHHPMMKWNMQQGWVKLAFILLCVNI